MTASSPRRSSSTDLALIAGFGALVAVCAVLPSINVAGPVPITLQTFGLLLAGAVLGARRGFLAVLLYLAVGAAGLPVFAGGTAGLGVFSARPSATSSRSRSRPGCAAWSSSGCPAGPSRPACR